MKRIIITLFFLIAFSSLYAQGAKPTKQETMDWLAGKMKQYLTKDEENKRYFQSYSNGVFAYVKYLPEEDNGQIKSRGSIVFYIDLNKVTSVVTQQAFWKGSQENITENYLRLVIKGNNLVRKDLADYRGDKTQVDRYEDNVPLGAWDYEPDKGDTAFNFDLESALRERALKAIRNLITYNTNSGNEAY